MKYQITSDELAWRKRKVVRMYAISFALACIIALPAVHADPHQYIIPGIGTGLICLVAAFFTIRRSLATLQRFPIEVTAEAITLPYQNKRIRIPLTVAIANEKSPLFLWERAGVRVAGSARISDPLVSQQFVSASFAVRS